MRRTAFACGVSALVLLAAAVPALGAGHARTATTIAGTWNIPSFPGQVRIVSAGGTAYRMVVSKPWPPCASLPSFRKGETWGRFSGRGPGYTGTATWYDNNLSCTKSRKGTATLTRRSATKLRLCSVDPFGQKGNVCFDLRRAA